MFRLCEGPREFYEPQYPKGRNTMNETMSIARSCEEGMYILREGDCLWRVNEEGMVDCVATGHMGVFEQLAFIQQWRTPSRSLLTEFPQQHPSK